MFRGSSFVLSAIVGTLLLTLFGTAQTDIPKVISYQGKATDSGGTPVADGIYPMRFWICDAATGGAILWDSGAQSVAVNGGVFNVLLGESPQPMIGLDFDQDYWLLVRFNGVDQTPRQRLASVGYAYMASGLVAGTEVIGSVTTGTSSAIKATNTATTGYRNGVFGESHSTAGRGVYGYATASTGATYGGRFQSASPSGTGVHGAATSSTGTTYGVYGYTLSANGRGVYGYASSGTGTTFGGRFESSSPSGTGVRGDAMATTGTTYAIYGRSLSSAGTGVYGLAQAAAGITFGGKFESLSPSGTGVYGAHDAATGTDPGVLGVTSSGSSYAIGVLGQVEDTTPGSYSAGVRGINNGTGGFGIGVYGSQDGSGWGVYGTAVSGSGVLGFAANGTGVKGYTTSDDLFNSAGVWGEDLSGQGAGVRGHKDGTQGIAVYGINDADTGTGVAGESLNYHGVAGLSYNAFGVVGYTEVVDDNYGLYTLDNLYSQNYHTAGAVMHLARNAGGDLLEPNDVVVFSGVAAPRNAAGPPIVEVAKATSANSTAVAGVVYSRFNIEAVTQESHPLTGEGYKPGLEVTPEGPVPPGEYLLLVVQGPTQVKASALAGAIRPGDLLASAPEAGYGEKATELTIDGQRTAMPGSVFGKALESLEGGQGAIYAFVTLQ